MMDRRSRLSGKRRSSILKIDLNREDETTGILFNKSRGQSRRVSFAETAQIKEFPRDSPRVWRQESTEDDQDKGNEPSRSKSGVIGGASVMGLDSLLNGTTESQSYQNIIHCPIPDMSADSFSLCDGNKTTIEQVDMETTLCMEPGMPNFLSEPSMEIKFDASSLLASLRSNPQSLSPMKLYSPQRESLELAPSVNLPSIMKDFQTGKSQNKLVDSKTFLSGLFGSKERTSLSDLNGSYGNEDDEMDETTSLDSVISSRKLSEEKENQHPVHLVRNLKLSNSGNKTVLGDAFAGIEETRCIGGILAQSSIDGKSEPVMTSVQEDRTKYFEENEETDKMEETKCHGIILKTNETNLREENGMSKTERPVTGNKTITGEVLEFEETACIGGIISDVDKENVVPMSVRMSQFQESDKTRYFRENETINVMEETQCVGRIMKCEISTDKVDNSFISEKKDRDKMGYYHGQDNETDETKYVNESEPSNMSCNGSKITTNTDSNKTILFTSDKHHSNIEETACIGVILTNNPNTSETEDTPAQKTDETEDTPAQKTDETEDTPAQKTDDHKDRTRYFTENQNTFIMDETTCGGGLMQALSVDEKLNNSSITGLKTASCLEESRIRSELEEGSIEVKGTSTGQEKQTKSNDTSNVTKYFSDSDLQTGMEETSCIGGLVDKTFSGVRGKKEPSGLDLTSTLKSHDFHNTILGNVTMEETKNIGVIHKDDISELDVIQADGNNSRLCNNTTDLQREKTTEVCIVQETINNCSKEECIENANSDKTQDLDRTTGKELKHGKNSDRIDNDINCEQLCPDITDTEITFKTTVKRTASERKTGEMDAEKTKELTDTALKKIKGMLMMSAQKTVSHIKAGIIKTPSKPSPDDVASLSTDKPMMIRSQTSSPAHKRIRLFEPKANEAAKSTEDLGVCPITELETGLGIDDETMPDCMQTDILSSAGGDNDTQLISGVNTTQSADDSKTNSSGNLSNMSMWLNRSIMAKPQDIPDGPLSLETFFKLTAKPLSCISGGRFSIPFSPKIDYDSVEEVLEAEIVEGPLVEAKKNLHKRITERQHKNEENVVWLQKTLEETQPQIFQDVARGDTEEIKGITEKLFTLFSCCSKQANATWKQETKKMLEETVDRIEDEGLKRVETILDGLKSQIDEVDHLLDLLDNDLMELENSEKLLGELEDQESRLESELHKIHKENEKNQVIEQELRSRYEKDQKDVELLRTRAALRQQILQQLMLVDWNLDEFSDNFAVFSFLEGELCVKICFKEDQSHRFIKDIDFQISSEPSPWLRKRMARSLMLIVLDKECLLQKYADFTSLPKILQEISAIVSEINKITTEVGELNKHHKLSWTNNVLSFELWNIETLRMVKVMLTYPRHATSVIRPEISIKCQMGLVSEADIAKSLQDIEIRSPYLKRLVQIVETKLSEHV